MSSAANLYASVVNDVISSVKDSFLDEGVDEHVLQELKGLWEGKLTASRTTDHEIRSQEAMLEAKRLQQQQLQQGGAASASRNAFNNGGGGHQQQQLVITDPDRLVPVQITIPAQPGNPHSKPGALTVQVPAHALQQSGPTSFVLQNLLTQAITKALDLPESHAAVFLQEQINSAFKLSRD